MARGWTQESLAEKSGLSVDTVRRLEKGAFSPGLDTLRKLCGGLDLQLSTLFESYDLNASARMREIVDLVGSRSDRDLEFGLDLLRAAYARLDAREEEEDDDSDGDDDADGTEEM